MAEALVPPICPRPETLRKYGLTGAGWWAIFHAQGAVCAICRRPSGTGRYNIDHEHVKGWIKLDSSRRRWFVRGIVCHFCNHYYLARAITPAKARAVVEYLEAYEYRKGLL